MDGMPWSWVGDHSGWVVVLFVIWCLITDKLVWHKRLDDKAHEANEWRTESRIKDQQIREQEIQLGHLAEVGKTVDAIMRSIHRNAKSGDRGSREEGP